MARELRESSMRREMVTASSTGMMRPTYSDPEHPEPSNPHRGMSGGTPGNRSQSQDSNKVGVEL